MTTSAIISLALSALTGLAVIARIFYGRKIEREVREKVELEQELKAAEEYKETRRALDEAVGKANDATLDELREWLHNRGKRKP